MTRYAELDVTTNFTFLRGGSHAEELVATAKAVQVLYDYATARPRAVPDPVVAMLEAYEGRSLRS